jgi:mono/diheme cytochrome c family protein
MKKLLKIAGLVLAALVVLVAAFVAVTYIRWNKTYNPPFPSISRATEPEALARGERLFRSICSECHTDESGRASGKPLADFPAFLGEYHSGNLTSDPTHGVGGWTDAELARFIRSGIDRRGRPRAMVPTGRIGDPDVAAIIGFMRSGDALFAPVAVAARPTKLTLPGAIIFTWLLGIRDDAPLSVPVPRAELSAAYGEYVAHIYDCGQCHTAGFSASKDLEPGAFGGGFEFDVPNGEAVVSPNLTFHESGLGNHQWTAQEFIVAVRDGVMPDGRVLLPPMGRFRFVDDTELTALLEYLKTVPKLDRPRTRSQLAKAPGIDAKAEALWTGLGCAACHDEGAPFRDRLKQSLGKPVAEVASWIRDPQAKKPGTQMPTFRDVLDEPRSLELAAWVQARAAAMK